ncbi:MAG: efflux RND transporter periplasmic adaptor subunit [Alphaproteobacteria bacterium]|nr:efflux RND transporter periplasmic adaptor subunit [Alphaproteobacteria bacterium]
MGHHLRDRTSRRAVRALWAALVTAGTAASASAAEFTVAKVLVDDLKAGYATVEATDLLDARARIGGSIAGLVVDEGSMVTEGQVIATVGDRKLTFEMSAIAARAQSLNAERAQALTDYNRVRELTERGVTPKTRLTDAETKLKVAERNLAAMEAERDVVGQRAKEGNVLSPAAGRVVKVHISDGSVVMPGDVIAVVAPEKYVLRMRLPERNARFVAVGTPVLVGPRGLDIPRPEALSKGEVAQVYPSMDQGRVVADVKLDGLGDFFIGERAMVYVTSGTREALVVPAEAISRRFGVAYVRLKGGAEVVVQPGQPVRGGTEILAGLNEGDVVVTP